MAETQTIGPMVIFKDAEDGELFADRSDLIIDVRQEDGVTVVELEEAGDTVKVTETADQVNAILEKAREFGQLQIPENTQVSFTSKEGDLFGGEAQEFTGFQVNKHSVVEAIDSEQVFATIQGSFEDTVESYNIQVFGFDPEFNRRFDQGDERALKVEEPA